MPSSPAHHSIGRGPVYRISTSAILAAFACATLLLTPLSAGATLTDINAGFVGVEDAAVAWGDYDADGDLDCVITGNSLAGPILKIYRNNGASFSNQVSLAGIAYGAVAWGDIDRDGDLDLAVAGWNGSTPIAKVYRNNSGVFVDVVAGMEGVQDAGLAWCDYDNDGDLDLAISGWNGAAAVAHVYRNDGSGAFTDAGAGLQGLRNASVAWADFDSDGDFDLLICGGTTGSEQTTLYRNTAGAFAVVATGLTGVRAGTAAWADYDLDGDPDVLLSGFVNDETVSELWRNDPGQFTYTGLTMGDIAGAVAWGDYEADGDFDVVMTGTSGTSDYATLWLRDGSFSPQPPGIPDLERASLAWGDYNNDGDLDLLVAGNDALASTSYTRIYANTGGLVNSKPAAPTGLTTTFSATKVTFQWNAATDGQTPSNGLSYNLWVGTSAGTANVMAPMANLANGFRRVPQTGNVGEKRSWSMARSLFPGGAIFWGVQAIDAGYAGSLFANSSASLVDVPSAPAPERAAGLRLLGSNPLHGGSGTRLGYTLTRPGGMRLDVFDAAGRLVRTLASGEATAGDHEARWAGDRVSGERCAPGVYLARLRTEHAMSALRLLVIN